MRRRIPKTPATVIGDEIRKTAIAYKADGQGERAEGMIDAANRIDAWLFAKTKVSLKAQPIQLAYSGAPLSSSTTTPAIDRAETSSASRFNAAALHGGRVLAPVTRCPPSPVPSVTICMTEPTTCFTPSRLALLFSAVVSKYGSRKPSPRLLPSSHP